MPPLPAHLRVSHSTRGFGGGTGTTTLLVLMLIITLTSVLIERGANDMTSQSTLGKARMYLSYIRNL